MNKKEISKARKELILERRRVKDRIHEIDKERLELQERDSLVSGMLSNLEKEPHDDKATINQWRKSFTHILRFRRKARR